MGLGQRLGLKKFIRLFVAPELLFLLVTSPLTVLTLLSTT